MAGGSNVQVSLSLGIATGEAAEDIEKLLQAADAALVSGEKCRTQPRGTGDWTRHEPKPGDARHPE